MDLISQPIVVETVQVLSIRVYKGGEDLAKLSFSDSLLENNAAFLLIYIFLG